MFNSFYREIRERKLDKVLPKCRIIQRTWKILTNCDRRVGVEVSAVDQKKRNIINNENFIKSLAYQIERCVLYNFTYLAKFARPS